MTKRYIPSRFNVKANGDENEFLLANLYTGAFGIVPEGDINLVKNALKKNGIELTDNPEGIIADLIDGGFLIEESVDEFRRARYLHETGIHRSDKLFLTLMPTEQCNFRCVYCYESFLRGEMLPEVREGIINFVKKKSSTINDLFIDWFGGEPLIAFSVIEELSKEFIKISSEKNIKYGSSITTNGYLLTPNIMEKCLKYHIKSFQITVDGTPEEHDQRRVLRGGQGTFEKIFNNLINLHNTDLDFHIDLRTNFDLNSLPKMEKYIELLVEKIGDDERFSVRFRPVSKLGGPNDENLPVCQDRGAAIYKLTEMAIDKGLHCKDTSVTLQPHSFVCYAAQNFAYVIGSDGTIYKCTVALDSDFNKVGKIEKDGTMNLNYDLMALWITSDENEDEGCQKCFFRPVCQGSACPLVRIETGKAPCPSAKYHVKDAMRLTWKQHKRNLVQTT
jgi:uncharacterized protein